MERELWLRSYRLLRRLASRSRPPRHLFSDRLIVAVYLWSVLHDRPVCWAACVGNWPADLLPLPLPSQSTLSRRLRSHSVRGLLDRLMRQRQRRQRPTLIKTIDSKPFAVGTYSRCRDARWGEAVRTKARGYKFFAVYGRGVMPLAWDVSSMNASEGRVGRRLLRQVHGSGYVLGDSAFDINYLYQAARHNGHQLVAPRKQPQKNVADDARDPARLRAIDLLEMPGRFGRDLYRLRTRVERQLARLTNTAGGLHALPNWVRRLPTVRRYIQAKLILLSIRHDKHPLMT